MDYEIRPITGEEFPKFARTIAAVFGESVSDEDVADWKKTTDLARTVAVFDGDEIVGTAGSFAFQLTVPGLQTLPVAGVTAVSVLPTHRRQGLLTAMMTYQMKDVRERGEPLAILLASESIIYGRFGYGLATTQATYEIDPRHAGFATHANQDGRLRMIDKEAAASILPDVYDRYRLVQPGAVTRNGPWWDRHFSDPQRWRNGASERYYVTYENASGEVNGFATYRIKENWDHGFPQHKMILTQLIATDSESRVSLWRFCLGVDLVASVEASNFPVEEPLRWMLKDPRRFRLTDASDFLWVRLVDIPGGLSGRRYSTEGRIVFDVDDGFCPENSGRYLLEAGPGCATATRTDEPADLSVRVADLGAAYMGGVGFTTLARANRVKEHTPGALRRADAMFASDPQAWCCTEF
jgi:predicted acetyltransferase